VTSPPGRKGSPACYMGYATEGSRAPACGNVVRAARTRSYTRAVLADRTTAVAQLAGDPHLIGRRTCRLIIAHPDTPAVPSPGLDVTPFAGLIQALGLFVTTDPARCADGAWQVIEASDGQVGDRPLST
jgi:hypothetical protein